VIICEIRDLVSGSAIIMLFPQISL